jgi:hypothetical protein
VNEALAARHARAIERWLGPRGRLVSYENTLYLDAGADHFVEFNAAIWFNAGQVWWGDLDLTLDEPILAGLAAETGETVYVVWEDDGHGRLTRPVSHEQAIYRVSPDGEVGMMEALFERDADGRLLLRGTSRDIRRRVPRRPTMWRFWRSRLSLERWAGPRGTDGNSALVLAVGGRGVQGDPVLSLACAWFRNAAVGAWIEVEWHPGATQRSWARGFTGRLTVERGPVRPWLAVRFEPGDLDRVQLGLSVGPKDPRWG